MPSAFIGWRSYTLVELPVMLFFIGQTVTGNYFTLPSKTTNCKYLLCLLFVLDNFLYTGAVTTDLMVYRSCQFLLGSEETDCDLLHTDSNSKKAMDLHEKVQPFVSYIIMYKSFVDGLVPAFLSFFLGPWSDKYGRKPLLVASYAGKTRFYNYFVGSPSPKFPEWNLSVYIFFHTSPQQYKSRFGSCSGAICL